ncbi:hypothetical protein D9M71_619640 [compost metagenome]
MESTSLSCTKGLAASVRVKRLILVLAPVGFPMRPLMSASVSSLLTKPASSRTAIRLALLVCLGFCRRKSISVKSTGQPLMLRHRLPFLLKYWLIAAPKFFSLASFLLPQPASKIAIAIAPPTAFLMFFPSWLLKTDPLQSRFMPSYSDSRVSSSESTE